MNADGLGTWDDLPGFLEAWRQAQTGKGIRPGADIYPDLVLDHRDAQALLEGVLRGNEGNWQPDDQRTFDVEWDPDATLIGPAQVGLMLKSAAADGCYVLDAAMVHDTALDVSPGKTLVIHGLGVRQIASAQTVGNDLVLQTDYAPLTDAVRNGDIGWNYGILFSSDRVAPQAIPMNQVLTAQGTYQPKLTFEVNNYECEIGMSLDEAATPKKTEFHVHNEQEPWRCQGPGCLRGRTVKLPQREQYQDTGQHAVRLQQQRQQTARKGIAWLGDACDGP